MRDLCVQINHKLIFGNGAECEHATDNVRSRLYGIREPPWPSAKFNILDVIEPYREEQNMNGVQVFIDAGPDGDTNNMFNLFNYQKPTWYAYEAAMFLLQYSVRSKNRLITRDDFKLMIIPTETISKKERVHVFDIMMEQIKRATDIIDKPRRELLRRAGSNDFSSLAEDLNK